MSLKTLVLAAVAAVVVASPAGAAVTVTYFGAAQWGASDATLGVAGYTIEDFENANLVGGLKIALSGSVSGNFAATSVLPATSVFDPSTDPALFSGQPIKAFSLGTWDGSHGLINNPGPSFAPDPSDWYNYSNWKDLTFLLPVGVTSVGFSLEQVQTADTILINGNVVVGNLIELVGPGTATYTEPGCCTFNARNGYLRFDSDAAITSLQILSTAGDGYMIDHFAFNAQQGGVPEPTTWALMISGFSLVGAAMRRRRAIISA